MDFNTTGQLLMIYSAFIKYLIKKMGIQRSSASALYRLKKAYDSVRREVFYNILIEFAICMKLVFKLNL